MNVVHNRKINFADLIAENYTIVIAEIGINHNGSLITAKKLIHEAKQAGVDAVKFQFRNLDNVYVKKTEIGDEILSLEITKNVLTVNEIIELVELSKTLGLMVGISFFSADDVKLFDSSIAKFDFFKVPSVELTNKLLIEKLFSLDKFLLISTGAADEDTIEKSLNNLQNEKWIPLHCVSNYPVATHNSKLGYIKYLQKRWKRPVGYSSHDLNWSIVVAAIIFGAKVIERHITLDKKNKGLDHSSSSTAEEFQMIVDFARNKSTSIAGDTPRTPNQGELLNLQNLGRSYFARRNIGIGEEIKRMDFIYASPRTGIGNTDFDVHQGKIVLSELNKGDVLSLSHLVSREKIDDDVISFANEKLIGLPVRLHDYGQVSNLFKLNNFEFHLSFGEINGLRKITKVNPEHNFSVHLPDYLTPNDLLNPFSDSEQIKNGSLKIIRETVDFANRLSDMTNKRVGVVGSFSSVENGVAEYYDKYTELTELFSTKSSFLALQWLPPIAWYFGGSVKLDIMNNLSDINYILAKKLHIVMDTAHLFMGQNYNNYDANYICEQLKSLTCWFHISGASGIDGEGTNFDLINNGQKTILKNIILNEKVKIVEVWQGHLDKYLGFQQALENIRKLFRHE